MGVYRTDENYDSKVCPNIFLSEDSLAWNRHKNVYTAHELLLMKPIFDRGRFYYSFLASNLWVFGLLPNMYQSFDETSFSPASPLTENTLVERVFRITNKAFMKLQLWYMRKKKTVEVTEANLIHFKKNDNLDWILKSYEKRLQKLKLN